VKAVAQELAPGPGRNTLASKLIASWPSNDTTSAFAWALTLPEPANLAGALTTLAERHPSVATDFLKNAPAGPVRDAALTGLAYGTLQRTPTRAMELLFTFGSTETRPRLVNSLVGRWADQQPREAAAWAQSLPSGAIRDRALAGVAGPLAQKDPPTALSLLPLVQDAESRYQIARQALLGQQRTDEAGARRTLANLNLPAADLARLRDDLDSHR
jgi:hypothetical protein